MEPQSAREDALDFKDPRHKIAFPRLSDEQIAALEPLSVPLDVPAGEALWNAGDSDLCMFVVIDGLMSIRDGRTQVEIAKHVRGGFSGDIDVLSGRPAVVGAVAETDLKLLKVPGEAVRRLVDELPVIGNLILSAFLMRRAILQDSEVAGPLVVGSRYSSDTLRIREFLSRNRYPFVWQDLESSPDTNKFLEEFKVGIDQTPIVVLPTGGILKIPSNRDLGTALGITRPVEAKIYDLVIVGAGPAGIAAAVYGASEGLSTLLIDAVGPGGQAGSSSRIENYMGFPGGLSGQDLADRGIAQAERFGAEVMVPGSVTSLACAFGRHELVVDTLGCLDCRCVILATGARYRDLEVPDLARYLGKGIFYAATHVERILCQDAPVAVVGAGNSAGQAAVFLAEASKRVLLIVRGSDLRKSMSSYLARRIEQSDRIELMLNAEICSLEGEERLEGAVIADRRSGSSRQEQVAGVFVMIGALPCTDWLPEKIAKDAKGFVSTGLQLVQENQWKWDRVPLMLETSCQGVFAAGDVRAGSVKRVASAVGEGSMAVAMVHQYLAL